MENPQLLLSNQVCFPIYSASRLITKAYKPHLNKLGITYPQYLVMMVLWENDNVTINHISEKLRLNTNTLSPLLQRMEKQEILNRNRSAEDERSVLVKLTEKGKQMEQEAAKIPDQLTNIFLDENVKLEDVLELKEILNKWIDILSKNNK
jgi:DNA-binding MarR family transcriptional regulator